MWHVQADPQDVAVIPAIRDELVTLADAGSLPAAAQGSSAAWFGEPSTGTYCGNDFATIKQTPNDGCTSTHAQAGALTSPSFSLAGRSGAYVVFRGWWEIEAVNADIADQMRVEYSAYGGPWTAAGSLNPLDPSWGGRHQSFTDAGARSSASWQSYAADLSGAAGAADVRVRFVFDTVDRLRNGFRGLLVDGVAIVDPLGATITEPQAASFTDAPPSVSVGTTRLVEGDGTDWSVDFKVLLSHPVAHAVGADWKVTGQSGTPVATGHADLPAGQVEIPVSVPVTGGDAPYTATLTAITGGTLAPGAGSASTPGGALPLLTLDSVGAAATPGGTVSVAIGVRLSAPATGSVSVDYALTGSDGVVVATGTLVVPAGAVTATRTVTVPAEHAPFTIGLSNARGALLDPAGSSATTSPLAGIASLTGPATDPGSQLILGVRIAGSDTPTVNRDFVLTVVSGTIRYHVPDGSYKTLASGSLKLPLGSVVDATNGHALITVAVDAKGTLQQIEIWDGKAGVFQVGNPVVTELRLAGGDYSVCAGASRKRRARHAGSRVIRKLWGQAKGSFRTKGRYASATVRGTKWLTEDLCLATRITVAEGVVGVFDFRRHTTRAVRAGDSATIGALQSARYRKRRGLHPPKLSRRAP